MTSQRMAKNMHSLVAAPEDDERYKPTGLVAVWAFASWLKNAPQITASLTPKQARQLAIDLLMAADHVEAQS